MKHRLLFKTPDVLWQIDELEEGDREDVLAVVDKFVEYGEHLEVEFDTLTGLARVVEVG